MTIRTLILAAAAALFLAGSPAFAQEPEGDCTVLAKDVLALRDSNDRLKADVAYHKLAILLERNLADLEGLRAAVTETDEAEMLQKLSETNVALMQNKQEFKLHIKEMNNVLQKIRQSKCQIRDMTSRLDKTVESILKLLRSSSARIDNSIERNNKTLEYYDYLKRS